MGTTKLLPPIELPPVAAPPLARLVVPPVLVTPPEPDPKAASGPPQPNNPNPTPKITDFDENRRTTPPKADMNSASPTAQTNFLKHNKSSRNDTPTHTGKIDWYTKTHSRGTGPGGDGAPQPATFSFDMSPPENTISIDGSTASLVSGSAANQFVRLQVGSEVERRECTSRWLIRLPQQSEMVRFECPHPSRSRLRRIARLASTKPQRGRLRSGGGT